MRSLWFIISSTAEPQDECMNCGKLYLVTVPGVDNNGNNNNTTVGSKGFCKKCSHNPETGSLSDKESSYSIKQSSPEMSFHESEEEEDELEEDAYLEVIDWEFKNKLYKVQVNLYTQAHYFIVLSCRPSKNL